MSSDHLNSPWSPASRASDDNKLLKPHVEEYVRMAHTCVEKMSRLWNEIEFPRDDRLRELDDISQEVKFVWSSAVEKAEKRKEEYQRRIDDAVQEIYRFVSSTSQTITGVPETEFKKSWAKLRGRYIAKELRVY